MSVLLAEKYRRLGCPVYTNMTAPGFIHIESLDSIPLDYNPKVLLLDEAYYFLDARLWKNNTASSVFFNTIGKQNILLIVTAISPETIEKRIREQMNFVIYAKGSPHWIDYKIIDVQRKTVRYLTLEKNEKLFSTVQYDTLQVPDIVDINLKEFAKKVKRAKETVN